MMRDESDESLFAKFASNGDERLFEEIVRRKKPRLMRYLLSRIRNREYAEEACQEVFLLMFRNRGRFDPGNRLDAWMFTIALYQVINLQRRRKSLKRSPVGEVISIGGLIDPIGRSLSPPEELSQRESMEEAIRWLGRLGKNGDAIRCVYLDDLTYQQTADALGVSIGTVKSRIHYGIEQAQKIFQAT